MYIMLRKNFYRRKSIIFLSLRASFIFTNLSISGFCYFRFRVLLRAIWLDKLFESTSCRRFRFSCNYRSVLKLPIYHRSLLIKKRRQTIFIRWRYQLSNKTRLLSRIVLIRLIFTACMEAIWCAQSSDQTGKLTVINIENYRSRSPKAKVGLLCSINYWSLVALHNMSLKTITNLLKNVWGDLKVVV